MQCRTRRGVWVDPRLRRLPNHPAIQDRGNHITADAVHICIETPSDWLATLSMMNLPESNVYKPPEADRFTRPLSGGSIAIVRRTLSTHAFTMGRLYHVVPGE
jgi:hypothetical protein